MKTKSPSHQGNKKYTVGSRQTPIGPAGVAIWLTEVTGIDRSQPHMLGIKRVNDSTVWVRDNDAGALQLLKDRDRMLESERKHRMDYADYLRQQKHGR